MKVVRFAVVGLCAVGVGVCLIALSRLAGLVPPTKLPPYPAWTGVHFAMGVAFALLLPLQLWGSLRQRRPGLHRVLGRTAVAIGAVMALSGLAIAHLAPERPLTEKIFMTTFFLVFAALLGLGLRAALVRDLVSHRAWMMRMTATALTPITQRIIFPVFAAGLGVDSLATFWQIFISAAWIAWGLNLVTAEVLLRRPQAAARLARA